MMKKKIFYEIKCELFTVNLDIFFINRPVADIIYSYNIPREITITLDILHWVTYCLPSVQAMITHDSCLEIFLMVLPIRWTESERPEFVYM